MCTTSTSSGSCCGGRINAAGTRKTIVVWYDWLRGVRTMKSCAIAAAAARTANPNQFVVVGSLSMNGSVTAAAPTNTSSMYARAIGDRLSPSRGSRIASSGVACVSNRTSSGAVVTASKP